MALRTKPVLTSACKTLYHLLFSHSLPVHPTAHHSYCSHTGLPGVLKPSKYSVLQPYHAPPTPTSTTTRFLLCQVSFWRDTFISTSYKRATIPLPGFHVTLTRLNHHLPYIFYLFIVCPLILDCKLYEGRDLAFTNYCIVSVYFTLFLAHSRA